jgi:hypothetical protein
MYICKLRQFFQSPNIMCDEEACPVRPGFNLEPGNCIFYRVTFCKDCSLYPGEDQKCLSGQLVVTEFTNACKRFRLGT